MVTPRITPNKAVATGSKKALSTLVTKIWHYEHIEKIKNDGQSYHGNE